MLSSRQTGSWPIRRRSRPHSGLQGPSARFRVEHLEGAWKLNEEENDADLEGTRRGLEAECHAGELLAQALAKR
ncbi:FMN-binding negative transcriptional regulator (plasmid) [Mesorhizobium loti]|nr:FMN-binding negative transcriptional regulator [Mesorhizobium loti]